jgi:TetR/AcrR family transcriptional regulator
MSSDPASSRQGEHRRREIVRVATDVFGEFGFAGARIDEVARRVGIRRPSILYHYPDKQQLYQAAIAQVVSEIAEQIRGSANLPGERLEAIADAWIDFVIERPNAARLLLRQMIDPDPIQIQTTLPAIQEIFEAIAAALEEQAGLGAVKPIDIGEFSLVLASTSLVWVASRDAVESALGIDTLAPQAIQRHRRMLRAMMRHQMRGQWNAVLEAADEARQDLTDD